MNKDRPKKRSNFASDCRGREVRLGGLFDGNLQFCTVCMRMIRDNIGKWLNLER